MAKKNPNDRKGPGNPDPNDPKSKADLPEWLRTDDWLNITPPPIKKALPETPSSAKLTGDEQKTDMIELDEGDDAENIDVPPSTMLFSDPDDSVLLSDDLAASGPLSGKISSGKSSIKLPTTKADQTESTDATSGDSKDRNPTVSLPEGGKPGEDAIDLGVMPAVENPAMAGPSTSGIRRPGTSRPAASPQPSATSEDAIGQPLKPTQPASGWLRGSTVLPDVPAPGSKSRMPSVPSTGNMNATWAELDLPASKLQPPIAKTPEQKTPDQKSPEQHPDSWHPSSGNIGVPSMANIDLPPEVGTGSDIFSKASRPGTGPGAVKIEIPKPKPIAKSEEPKAPTEQNPATPSLQLPSIPEVPAESPKGSWHPSSGNLLLPSMGEIDLPPDAEGSDIFSKAVRPGRGIEDAKLQKPRESAKSPAPPPPAPLQAPAKPLPPPQPTRVPPPTSLSATQFEVNPDPVKSTGPASGWLAGTGKSAAPPAPVGLDPTSDFQSSADIDLPPEKTEGASDIFSTATKPTPRSTGGSGIFSGALAPDSLPPAPSSTSPGDSNLFTSEKKKETLDDTGRVDLVPPGLEITGELKVSPLLPGSKSDAINFALPGPSIGDSRASSIEVVDTSGTLPGGTKSAAEALPQAPVPQADNLFDDQDSVAEDAKLESELARQLMEDDGKHDFDYLPGQSPSDSNILGDRSMSELSRSGPQSSSVNLADPNALSSDPAVDSGQPSSIFNKIDQSGDATGHVDLDEIPLMGSSDSGTMAVEGGNSAVLGGRLDEPHGMDLEESVFDVTMPKDEAADSGMIDWSADAAKVTDRLGMQASMEESLRSELSSASTEQPSMPATPRKTVSQRPTSRPDFDLDSQPEIAPSKPRNAILIAALSLAAGAGLGAGGMFLAGGNSSPKTDPVVVANNGDAAAKLAQVEKEVADARKQVESLTASNGQLKMAADKAEMIAAEKTKLENDLVDVRKRAEAAELDAKKLADNKLTLLADVKKATDEAAKMAALATNARKDAEDKAKLLDAAKLAADGAAAKLKAADGLLDPVLEKLKAAKLIDDKADREKALAAIPDALKKANLIVGEGEVAKLAKEISETRELLKKEKDEADKQLALAAEALTTAKKDADKQLTDAKAAAKKTMDELQAKLDTSDKRITDEVKKAVAVATKDADEKLTQARMALVAQQQAAKLELQKEATARASEVKRFEAQLAERTEAFEKQLAAARAGAEVPLSTLAVAKIEQSASEYDTAMAAYFSGEYAAAEKAFAAAIKANPADARFWYFLGLCKYAQGKSTEAAADFKTGAEWESRAKPGRRTVAAALENVQGPARLALEAYRP